MNFSQEIVDAAGKFEVSEYSISQFQQLNFFWPFGIQIFMIF